jgi:hypothetical protein
MIGILPGHYRAQAYSGGVQVHPCGCRIDPEYVRYLGDLIPGEAVQGHHLAGTAFELSYREASLVQPAPVVRGICIIDINNVWHFGCVALDTGLPGPVRFAPYLQDLVGKRCC